MMSNTKLSFSVRRTSQNEFNELVLSFEHWPLCSYSAEI